MISNLIRFLYFFIFSINAYSAFIDNGEIQLNPIITNFSPTEYCINSPINITITGTNLASVTTVRIGVTNVAFTASDTSIVITSIPMNTSSGRIRVIYPDGSDDTTDSDLTIKNITAKPNTPTGNSQICKGDGPHSYSVAAVTGADSYEWEFDPDISGDINIIGSSNERTISFNIPNIVADGNYNLTVRAVNSCGNSQYSSVKSFSIGESPANAGVITELNGATEICADGLGTIQLTVHAIDRADSYLWDGYSAGFDVVGSSDQRNITLRVKSNANPQNYNITVKGTNSSCGDGGSSTFAITVNSLPDLNSLSNETICLGENVQIGQDLGGGYSVSMTATQYW